MGHVSNMLAVFTNMLGAFTDMLAVTKKIFWDTELVSALPSHVKCGRHICKYVKHIGKEDKHIWHVSHSSSFDGTFLFSFFHHLCSFFLVLKVFVVQKLTLSNSWKTFYRCLLSGSLSACSNLAMDFVYALLVFVFCMLRLSWWYSTLRLVSIL